MLCCKVRKSRLLSHCVFLFVLLLQLDADLCFFLLRSCTAVLTYEARLWRIVFRSSFPDA